MAYIILIVHIISFFQPFWFPLLFLFRLVMIVAIHNMIGRG
jgi:hypothetical protein